ncbi:MAG: hypothetical protein J0L94_10205 [Rhodothermia bacterium]|nr:hypothetical protein [Rhodothermia bacterium]
MHGHQDDWMTISPIGAAYFYSWLNEAKPKPVSPYRARMMKISWVISQE